NGVVATTHYDAQSEFMAFLMPEVLTRPGPPIQAFAGYVQVAAGHDAAHALALNSAGTVAAWGLNANNECIVPAGLANVVAIAAGYDYSLALDAGGTMKAWGNNQYGNCTLPNGGKFYTPIISAGLLHSLAVPAHCHVCPNVPVIAWGDNISGDC